MAEDIAAKLRKNRELKITVGKFTFTARRPTDMETLPIFRDFKEAGDDKSKQLEIAGAVARDYVIGWEGMTEEDLIGGGGADPVPFSAETWREWSVDHRDMWQAITVAIFDAYQQHRERLVDTTKN